MSSDAADSTPDAEQNQSSDSDTAVLEDTSSQPLTITLPEGSQSVSDAILAHREMLRTPEEHGLATAQEITHLSEAIEGLSEDVTEVSQEYDGTEAEVAELQDVVKQQQQQIEELRSAVTSLAEILGTETEWQAFDNEQ